MKLFFALFLLTASAGGFAADRPELKVCTLKLAGGMVTDKDHGFLIDLLKETLGKSHDLDIEVFPIQRAVQVFMDGRCSVLATVMEGDYKKTAKGSKTSEGATGLIDYFTIFSREKELISKNFDNKGVNPDAKLRMIKVRSWNVPQYIFKDNKVYEANNMDIAMKMLIAKRADCLIGFNFLVRSYIDKKDLKNLVAIEGLKYEEKRVVFLFGETKDLKSAYSSKLLKLIKSGRYDELLKKHQVPSWLISDRSKLEASLKN